MAYNKFEMNSKTINDNAIKVMQNLDAHGHFEELVIIEGQIRDNKNPSDRDFYLSQEDLVNNIYGEIMASYGELLGDLKAYVAVYKYQAKLKAEAEKGKLPGDDLLKDLARGEVPDLYKAVIILESWVDRAENNLRTCRNHILGGGNSSREGTTEREKDKSTNERGYGVRG